MRFEDKMRYICPECGDEIPEDRFFCYSCGRKRDNTITLDDKGNFIHSEKNKCASCGAEMQPGDLFCRNCSVPLSRTQTVAFRPKMVKHGWIGLLLAVIPGALGLMPDLFGITFYSIFGLGHLYFKKWKRAGLYFLTTAMFAYIKYTGFGDSFLTTLIFVITTGFIFFLQAMEVFVLAYMPSKTEREGR